MLPSIRTYQSFMFCFDRGNVSFLALADITSMQRTASLASAIFSLVSITSGLYHVWHHRIKTKADQVEAVCSVIPECRFGLTALLTGQVRVPRPGT